LSKRDWQGRIVGKGLHGSLNALGARIKHKYILFRSHTPLIRLLTVCIKCCAQLELCYKADQINQIFRFKDKNGPLKEMVLRILYKEIEKFVSSKVIMIERLLLNAETVKTVGVDGK
jgi:hypothetical protein